MTKIAKAAEAFARYLACRPRAWTERKKDKSGGVTRRCTKCQVRETTFPEGFTTRWPPKQAKVKLPR